MTAPLADERQMLARTKPGAFDALRDMGRLSPSDRALNARRWRTGDELRRLHGEAWMATGGAVAAIQTAEAFAARARLTAMEADLEPALWWVVVRVVLEGAQVRECRQMLPFATPGASADAIILDRLCVVLDRIGAMLNSPNPST